MQNILAVFVGGGLGAVLRYLIGVFVLRYFGGAGLNFPAATFAVNIIGCFLLGFLFVFFIDKPEIDKSLKLALSAGFCGGLTTFSTFSLELFKMVENAHYGMVLAYLFLSIIVGFAAVWIGVNFAKVF